MACYNITMILLCVHRLMNIAAILNGIAGTTFFAGPPLIASIWFPLDQRATATAISSFFNYAGVGTAFIIGKLELLKQSVSPFTERHV